MFGLLKNKLKSFIDGLVKKEEEKRGEGREEKKEALVEQAPTPTLASTPGFGKKAEPEASIEEQILEEARREAEKERRETKEEEEKPAPMPVAASAPPRAEEEALVEEKQRPFFEPTEEKRGRDLAPRIGLFKRVTSLFSGMVTISEDEVAPLLQDLELSLLESDVSLDTTHFLLDDLRKRLVGKRVARNALKQEVEGIVRLALLDLLQSERIDLLESIREKKAKAVGEPFVVLFLGPNGMGKTTTIAKIAYWLKQKGLSSVFAASDCFRAAALEQITHHADKLGVKVIKHDYGADPTAVAFDAIVHARAKKIDVVLIDTAGRQETSLNLMKEMEKMNRVLKPDLRVFVGEAIAGHALVEQVKKFKEVVGVDAIVLTKIDCDAKGGGAFSLAFETKTPILFVGTGQEYFNLLEFDAEWLVEKALAA